MTVEEIEVSDNSDSKFYLKQIAVQLAKIHGELELINMREEYKMDLCPDCGEIHESTPEPTN